MNDREKLKTAVFELMGFSAARYLLSHSAGRENGAEKAQRHLEMSRMFVRVWHGPLADLQEWELVQKVHDETAKDLTNRMDEVIGFDRKAHIGEDVVQRFMEKFWTIASDLLDNQPAPSPDPG